MIKLLFVTALSAQAALSQVVLDRPLLRIEAGMHTSGITAAAVDASEKYLVSGSVDKTVRVWDVLSGELLRIIRPPMGEGNEGMIAAAAISPDGRVIACAGWTAHESDGTNSVYLLDRVTGRLQRRLAGLHDTIQHLAFSLDGRWLLVTLGRNNGIRLYRTVDWAEVGVDVDYGDNTPGADFTMGGGTTVLVTASYDGFVRSYVVGPQGSLQLTAKARTPGGAKPHYVAISPDRSRIAVCNPFSAKIDVLSGVDLSYLYSVDTTGFKYVGAVAWSADGNSIYAGAQYGPEQSPILPILKWPDGGRGLRSEVTRTHGLASSIHSLRVGLIFAASDPALGLLDPAGKTIWFHGPPVAQYSTLSGPLGASADGTSVQFSYESDGKSPASFTSTERILTQGHSVSRGQVHPPKTDGLSITDWYSDPTPKINGIPLPINDHGEISISLAISVDQRQFLLGTNWYLHLYDRNGVQKWRVSTSGGVASVNLSTDGRLAISALADGTIRWYRLSDGRELLAVFPDPDGKRWVLWTPSGYYDASPGGEDLIGWHLNNGKDASADFFPASRFRTTYYRPDIVSRVLQTLDEREALNLANAEAGRRSREDSIAKLVPPIVTVLSPADHSSASSRDIVVRYEIRAPSGEPVTLVRVLVDGRPAAAPRKLLNESSPGAGREVRVSIPDRDCEVSIIAENRYAASQPATVHIQWQGARQSVSQSTLYLLAIGISKYPEKFKLQWASKDAQDFAAAMQRQKGMLYRDVQVRLLRDQDATREAILDGLEWVEKSTTENDIGMLFLSGHGWNDAGGSYYFIPVNFDVNRLRQTAVPSVEVQKTVQTMAGKVVVFLDTCYSGNVLGGRSGELRGDINGVANELVSAENGAVVFTASSGRQVALERPEWGNGAFTKALMEGVGGKADMLGKGTITINALDYYISERVKDLTENQQTPTTAKPQTIADFPIAVRR